MDSNRIFGLTLDVTGYLCFAISLFVCIYATFVAYHPQRVFAVILVYTLFWMIVKFMIWMNE
jgi:uncharacterized membrane protein